MGLGPSQGGKSNGTEHGKENEKHGDPIKGVRFSSPEFAGCDVQGSSQGV